MFGALRRSGVDGWGYPENGIRDPKTDGKVRKSGYPIDPETGAKLF